MVRFSDWVKRNGTLVCVCVCFVNVWRVWERVGEWGPGWWANNHHSILFVLFDWLSCVVYFLEVHSTHEIYCLVVNKPNKYPPTHLPPQFVVCNHMCLWVIRTCSAQLQMRHVVCVCVLVSCKQVPCLFSRRQIETGKR